ncbi:MAG: CAP domain-containing protein [Chitinophagaceae bacterium]|jgi:uncharacterized protein YkwD|nr:CAP domain-containing protein [Chitinophagaceae bacterium]MBP9739335.1 CAP domain-containing protein [Chitinophagaceae bacterium]
MKYILFSLVVFSFQLSSVIAQENNEKKISVCLTQNEMDLYKLIMQYRKEKGLPSIPLSTSLSFVAQTHARDVVKNKPNVGSCNMHSWSSNGTWTSCCYTPDHKEAECMWNKPKQLTNYKGYGFEISFSTYHSNDATYTATAEESLQGWKTSSGHNDVIINQSIWKTEPWKSIGIGIYQGYACVWFGRETDVEAMPVVCK